MVLGYVKHACKANAANTQQTSICSDKKSKSLKQWMSQIYMYVWYSFCECIRLCLRNGRIADITRKRTVLSFFSWRWHRYKQSIVRSFLELTKYEANEKKNCWYAYKWANNKMQNHRNITPLTCFCAHPPCWSWSKNKEQHANTHTQFINMCTYLWNQQAGMHACIYTPFVCWPLKENRSEIAEWISIENRM